MRIRPLFFAIGMIGTILLAAGAAAAQGWTASVGASYADIGLNDNGWGAAVGAGRVFPFAAGRFDFSFSGEYVQKAGSQPRLFVPSDAPAYVDDEKIRLHILQPAVFLGVRAPYGLFVPRLYCGLSVALKVGETWTRPVDDGLEIIGYEETDFVAHVGASLRRGPLGLDLRWSQGLVSQLILDEGSQVVREKVDDPLAGVDPAENDAKLSNWQLGMVWYF